MDFTIFFKKLSEYVGRELLWSNKYHYINYMSDAEVQYYADKVSDTEYAFCKQSRDNLYELGTYDEKGILRKLAYSIMNSSYKYKYQSYDVFDAVNDLDTMKAEMEKRYNPQLFAINNPTAGKVNFEVDADGKILLYFLFSDGRKHDYDSIRFPVEERFAIYFSSAVENIENGLKYIAEYEKMFGDSLSYEESVEVILSNI